MKTLRNLSPFIFALLFLITGCEKNSLTNTSLTYKLNAVNLNASFGAPGLENGTVVPAGTKGSINWTSLVINVTKSEFKGKHESGDFVMDARSYVDYEVLDPNSISGKLNLRSGQYSDLKYNLSITASQTNPPVEIKGMYIYPSGDIVPVSVILNMTSMVDILDLPSQGIGEGDYVLNIRFKLNELLKNINTNDYQNLTISNDHKLEITDTSNKILYDKLLENFESVLDGDFYKE